MNRILIAAVLALTIARPAAAASKFDWKPYLAIAAGQGLDLATTIHDNPSHPCYETNPRLGGKQATTMSVLIPKLAIIGGVSALVAFTEHRESKAARVIAKTAAYLGGAVGAKDGVHNLRTCGW